jgi:hypothetical protein
MRIAKETRMPLSFRRLVTSRDAHGKSRLIEDAQIQEERLGNFNFWRTGKGSTTKDGDLTRRDFPFFADPGGTVFRIFRLPAAQAPMTERQSSELSAAFFSEIGVPSCRVDTSRHAFMHVTPTTDYIVLLSGEVSLLLDVGEPIALRPFDAVVQRSTNHAWVNTGGDDAILMAVMIGQDAHSPNHDDMT